MKRVRITRNPTGTQEQPGTFSHMGHGQEDVKINQSLKPIPREDASLEAEKGETVVTNLGKGGIPEFYTIGGKRHYNGGTPLNLPTDSFIFSRDRKMKINDKEVLSHFGKNVGKKGKKAFTPAELSKKYNLNKYLKILYDPDSDKMQRDTAELMIKNYNMKLGALALAQESVKGFEDGIPAIAMPYMEYAGIDPKSLVELPQMKEGGQPQPQQRHGGAPNAAAIKRIEPLSNVTYFQGGGGVTDQPLQRVRVSLPQYEGGGSPKTGRPTKKQNIPSDAVKWDMSAEGYDESQIEVNDYVLKTDGKWYKVTGYKGSPYTGDFADERLVGEHGDLQEAYGRLEQVFAENENFRKAFIKKYRKAIGEAKPKGRTGLTQAQLDIAKGFSEQEIIDNYLEMQKQIMSFSANQGSMSNLDKNDQWDKDRSNYTNAMTNLGFDPVDIAHAAAFQAGYAGFQKLKDDPEFDELLEDFAVSQYGHADEPGAGTGRATISDIDGWVGNTTIAQSSLYKPIAKGLEMTEAAWDEEQAKDPEHLMTNPWRADADWWLQDKIKTTGAALDLARIKKYPAWQGTPQMNLAKPTFKDPTYALHRNQALANTALQGAGTFGGPQGYAARSAAVLNKAFSNAAGVISGVHDANVDIANKFDMANTQIKNQYSDRFSQLATQLYDKNIIANQQFDNSKAQARQQLRGSLIDAVTNRAQAQTTNTLYDQFNVDPRSGGFLYHTGVDKPLDPSIAQKRDITMKAIQLRNIYPGMDYKEALSYAKADAGIPDTPLNNQLSASPFAYPGYQYPQ